MSEPKTPTKDRGSFCVVYLDGGVRVQSDLRFATSADARDHAEERLEEAMRQGDYGPPSSWVADYAILDRHTDEETHHVFILREAE